MPKGNAVFVDDRRKCTPHHLRCPSTRHQGAPPGRRVLIACAALGMLMLCGATTKLHAQISLASAVDLAERSNPHVLGAQADVARASAHLAETHAAYIPAITLGANFGQAYGYLPNPPTFFEVTAGSLVYSASQRDYIQSARSGLDAAQFALEDARETVAHDTALAYVTLDHDQQRAQAIQEQFGYATQLLNISQQRFDAGQDSRLDLTQAKLTTAKLHLASMQADDDVENDRDHLARLIGLPARSLRTDDSFPKTPLPETPAATTFHGYLNAAIASAFANAEAKQRQAKGDATFRFRPQINLVINYNRYATFTDSFKNLESTYKSNTGGTLLTADEAAFGVQISFPFLDRARTARAHASAAEAARAYHDAESAQIDALDGQERARHTIAELKVRAEVASLEQQISQQQLDILQVQLQSGTGNPNAPQMTPKDEANARIAERDKYIAVLDANFQLRQAEIQLLRQTGQLISWIAAGGVTSPSPTGGGTLPSAPFSAIPSR